MHFTARNPERLPRVAPHPVNVGDVYKAQHRNTHYWIVLAVHGRMCHLIGVNSEGVVVSTTSYGVHVLEHRALMGRCHSLDKLHITIDWTE